MQRVDVFTSSRVAPQEFVLSALVPAMYNLYGMRAFLFDQTGLNPGIRKEKKNE